MDLKNSTSEKAKRDAQLVKDALENGSQKAYSDLMSYYRDPLYYTLLKMMKNPYDAEDLTIEAFGKAFKNTSPQCVDEDFGVFENTSEPDSVQSQEESYMMKERARVMHWAVEQLRPKYRTLIELRYFQELSYEEISKELNISMNNVKIQLFRAKYMLSAIMDKMKNAI